MFLKDIDYTDPQGVNHPAAVFGIHYANRSTNLHENYQRNRNDMVTINKSSNNNIHIEVQFYYWASETLRLEEKDPYIIANQRGEDDSSTMSYRFDGTLPEYRDLSLEDACFYYLENTVLPS
jgi:hypothetical protein